MTHGELESLIAEEGQRDPPSAFKGDLDLLAANEQTQKSVRGLSPTINLGLQISF